MTSKFKVGDKVVFDELNKGVAKEFGYHPNKSYEVINVFPNEETIQIINENGLKNAFAECRFNLIDNKPSKNQRITALEETVAKQGEEISELKLIVAQIRKPSTAIQESLTTAPSVEDTPKRLTVGDIAKITGNKSPHNLEIGDIVKIVYDDNDHMPYKAERISDGKESLWLDEGDLEPYTNDIIEFEGKQYKKVDREAREGDVVIIHKPSLAPGVVKTDHPYLINCTFEGKVAYRDDITIAPCNFVVYDNGRTPETVDVYELIVDGISPAEKSPNEKRAEMIEKAKSFVDENGGDDYHFDIDEKEGTVFAYKVTISGVGRYGVKYGLSKCHPNDVFNADIGKAISFGRAEKLDVSEFEQAVQPNEVVIGHVATHEDSELDYTITKIDGDIYYTKPGGHYYKESFVNGSARIINDTNAQYETAVNE